MKKDSKVKKAAGKTAESRRPAQAKKPAIGRAKKARSRKESTPIPPILLEGDTPAVPLRSGPGQRYELGSGPGGGGPAVAPEERAVLPEAYGTKRLFLAAQDPHWLYAHWDLTRQQQQAYNARSQHRHLTLRIYREKVSGKPFSEIHVHPESRNWFVHVGLGQAHFMAVLGYYDAQGRWVTVSRSNAVRTPPDRVSEDATFWFETLPMEVRLDQMVELVKTLVPGNVPVVTALRQLREQGHPGLPSPQAMGTGRWTPEQERALAEVISMDDVRRIWVGSLDITELVRRQLLHQVSSLGVSSFSWVSSWSGAVSSISSPPGGLPPGKSFWFNVNAELILYGATEPDARVTVAGRPVKLRPDGSFSFRFALPDGRYPLPAVAVSADGTDSRSADLTFERTTQYRGQVDQHPQDPQLNPPKPEHVDE